MSLFEGPLFILEKGAYTLIEASSSLSVTGFPLSNCADRVHPIRQYRSQHSPSGVVTTIVLDVGVAATKIDAIFIDNTNLALWEVYTGTSSGDTPTQVGTGFTGRLDPLTGRGRVFIDLSSEPANSRYVRLSAPIQTVLTAPTDRAAVGGITIGFTGKVVGMPGGHPTTLDIVSTAPTIINEYEGGAREITQIGSRFVEITLPNDPFLREQQEEVLMAIINVDTAPFIFYENLGDLSRAYLVRHGTTKNKLLYTVGKVINFSINLIEVV